MSASDWPHIQHNHYYHYGNFQIQIAWQSKLAGTWPHQSDSESESSWQRNWVALADLEPGQPAGGPGQQRCQWQWLPEGQGPERPCLWPTSSSPAASLVTVQLCSWSLPVPLVTAKGPGSYVGWPSPVTGGSHWWLAASLHAVGSLHRRARGSQLLSTLRHGRLHVQMPCARTHTHINSLCWRLRRLVKEERAGTFALYKHTFTVHACASSLPVSIYLVWGGVAGSKRGKLED